MKPIVVVLSCCAKDVHLAELWLKRAAKLATVDRPPYPLVLFGDSDIPFKTWQALGTCGFARGVMQVGCRPKPGEEYPWAANHQFLEALKWCEEHRAGHPILWAEADTVLMRPKWYEEISAEYAACGRPFMGTHVNAHFTPHLAGCAVYPPNWRELAPSLAVLEGRAWCEAFDTACAHEIYPQSRQARTFQQMWHPPRFTRKLAAKIRPEVAFFHQCKDGTLYHYLK